MFVAFSAFSTINSRRGSTTSPIRVEKHLIRDFALTDANLQKRTIFRIQRRFPQLFGVHFAQTFVTLDGSGCGELRS